MADTSHLERMGRELKCPICLSLLNSAVSLTCNHVFCGSCIEKSMKSVSNCPVCKVPFRRREMRPAPHMDNLVSIYKSMEIASGVTIFVTQTAAPSTKISDHENQPDGDKVHGSQENSRTLTGPFAQENQERWKKKGRERSSKAKPGNTSLDSEGPSFPTKKRVHVPQFPPSETPMQSAKSKNETHEAAKSETEMTSRMQKDKLIFNENEEPVLSPFFWLREDDDAEKLTQQTDGDLMDTPPDVPCFSDIKDSDDEIPCRSTPNGEPCNASSAEYFDSEMFEWTQRACSPELYTSPVKMQVLQLEDGSRSGDERNGYGLERAAALLQSSLGNIDIMMDEKGTHKAVLACSPSPRYKSVDSGNKKSGKRGRKGVPKRNNKRPKKAVNELSGAPTELENATGQHMQKKNLNDEGNALDVIKKSSKRKYKGELDTNAIEKTSENLYSSSGLINPPADMSGLSDKKYRRTKTRKSVSPEKGLLSNLKAKKRKAAKDDMIQNQCEVLISDLNKASSPEEKHACNKEMVIRKCEVKPAERHKDSRRLKFLEENKLENNLVKYSLSLGSAARVTAEDTQKLGVRRKNSNGEHISKSSKLEDVSCLNECILDKREKKPESFLCVFCQSAEESELLQATGIMVHYLEGNPVAGDQIGEPHVIHSHKNCTEWAPNVFFQDDKAINLEAELMRSRRIKCCFCGLKGAALGCYEKSCRKSFHVPCAKITPECKWDYDNFVMLCPLHASSKLPCEVHVNQSNRKRKSVPDRPSESSQPQLVRDETKSQFQWKSHAQSKNLVLCCSGLTEIEKGIIYEFEKLSGVKVLKTWDTSVTHVITSVDENGACKRTLKFLMGVLEGKWILTTKWVEACMKSMGLVDEKYYEIEVDVHGIRNGPNLGRLRLMNKKAKLFSGYKFYFMGDFATSYKKYLHDLVIAGGGTVLNRKPISEEPKNSSRCSTSTTYIVYSVELPENCKPTKTTSVLHLRHADAKALARSTGSVAVSNTWILNSIAGSKLHNLTEYLVFQ